MYFIIIIAAQIFSINAQKTVKLWESCGKSNQGAVCPPVEGVSCCVGPLDLAKGKTTCRAKGFCNGQEVMVNSGTDVNESDAAPASVEEPIAASVAKQSVTSNAPRKYNDVYDYLTQAVNAYPLPKTSNFNDDCFASHNIQRSFLGRTQIKWNPDLQRTAQEYADELARDDKFEHSQRKLEPYGMLGENLYRITGGDGIDTSCALAVRDWFNEFPLYAIGEKIGSNYERFEAYGHFTALMWPKITSFACAFKQYRRGKRLSQVVVCHYDKIQQTGQVLDMNIPDQRLAGL